MTKAVDDGSARRRDVPILQVSNLGKTFSGQAALQDLGLSIESGEVHALLGENGSGKSTFIKILSGYHLPDRGGSVHIEGRELALGDPGAAYRLGARFVHQDLGLVGTSSVADNMFLGSRFPQRFGTVRTSALRAEARRHLEVLGLDLDPDTPVDALSPAMKTGVAVARALRTGDHGAVRLLVLDEPTATLPDHEVHQLLEIVTAVARRGVGVLYVTHRLDEIFQIADRVSVLRDGVKVAERLVDGLRRGELVELLVGRNMAGALTRSAPPTAPPRDQVVLSVRGLRASPIRSVSFSVHPGEIVGFAGITGSGRETLLGSVFGATDRTGGEIVCGSSTLRRLDAKQTIQAGAAYLPAERKTQGAMLEMTARENLTIVNLSPFRRRLGIERKSELNVVSHWFRKLGVRPSNGMEHPLTWFSGGNQQKILLAKWLRCQPKVLFLDEPTQGVDVGARAQIHEQLREAAVTGAAVLISSSDADELCALCHRVLVIRRGQIATELSGPNLTERNISKHSLGSEETAA